MCAAMEARQSFFYSKSEDQMCRLSQIFSEVMVPHLAEKVQSIIYYNKRSKMFLLLTLSSIFVVVKFIVKDPLRRQLVESVV